MSRSRAIQQPAAAVEQPVSRPPEEAVVAASLTAPWGIRVCTPITMATAAQARAALHLGLHRRRAVTGARIIPARRPRMRRVAPAMAPEAAEQAGLASISEGTASSG